MQVKGKSQAHDWLSTSLLGWSTYIVSICPWLQLKRAEDAFSARQQVLARDGSFTLPCDISDVLGGTNMAAMASNDTKDSASLQAPRCVTSGNGALTEQASTSGTTQVSASGGLTPNPRDITAVKIATDHPRVRKEVSAYSKLLASLQYHKVY